MANAAGLRTKLRRRAEEIAERAMVGVEEAVNGAAHIRSPRSSVGPHTIRRRKVSGPPRIAYTIQATSKIGEYTEKGTNPHVIRPRKAGGVLVFTVGGTTVFARFVNHPGNPPMPWFHDTIRREWPEALRREVG